MDLVELARPLDEISINLRRFPFDCDFPLVILERRHIAAVLRRFVDGQLTGLDIEKWANAIEGRDDIGYDPRSIVGMVLHELANLVLAEPMSSGRAAELLTSVA